MYASSVPGDDGDDAAVPSGNPFYDQFPRYFPDLRARRADCGHFIPEEAAEFTNETFLAFLAGDI